MPDDPDPHVHPDAAAWRAAANELAAVAWRLLVNRTDAWGAYLPPHRRTTRTRADGTPAVANSVTAPPKHLRGRVALTTTVLSRHFAGWCPGDVVGLHTTAPDNTSRWGLVEVDRHGDGGDPDANWRAVLHWYRVLRRLGFRPWLSDSNGRGGYHLRVVFDHPVCTALVYRFLRRLVRDHRRLGLPDPPEVFPKQPAIAPGGYGNWVRLPGRHHTRDHWTRLWTGAGWVAGDDAVAFLLAAEPDPVGLLPDVREEDDTPKTAPMPSVAPPLVPSPATGRAANAAGRMTDREVAFRCLAGIRNTDVHFDVWLAVGMALHSVDAGSDMLTAWTAWSRGSGKHVEGECERRWASFAAAGRAKAWRLGTLVHLARRDGHEPFPRRNTTKPKPKPPTPRRVATSLPAPAAVAAANSPFAARRSGRGVA